MNNAVGLWPDWIAEGLSGVLQRFGREVTEEDAVAKHDGDEGARRDACAGDGHARADFRELRSGA